MKSLAIATLTLLIATTVLAQSQTITIDEHHAGTVWDGLLDGFPNLGPKDGTADFDNNPLAVALQTNVTEERSAMEFPLADLAGVAPDTITAATLTFNVDDVIATFGPNTAFSGKAANTILVHLYSGDGAVTLADFKRTDEAATVVDTGPQITDQTLAASGAIVFHVDVRGRLLQALAAGTPFLGALWRTNDAGTATSIDDGRNGQMPGEGGESAAGAALPFLTVEITPSAPPPPPPPCANEGEACDDGNACTAGDTCTGGLCVGGSPCGNGTVEASCGEQCDDGNTTTADGCSACRFDTILGGTGPRECLLALATAPQPAGDGSVTCTDGDGCDADPTPGRCGFKVTACLGRADPRLPSCPGVAGVTAAVVKPGRGRKDCATRSKLEAVLAETAMPGCTAPVEVDVAIRQRGRRRRPGSMPLVLEGRVAGGGKDRDTLRLVCRPGP